MEPTTTKFNAQLPLPGHLYALLYLSSYAVSMGAQFAKVVLACVADGDVWTACELNPVANRRTAHTGTEQPRSQNATAGALCGSGCIWSTFAVSIGAQSSEASCDGAECACVVDGDVWTACGDTNDQSSNHDEQADQFAQDNPYQRIPTKTTLTKRAGRQTMPTARRRVALPLATVTISTTVPLATSSLTSRTKSAIDAEHRSMPALWPCHRKYHRSISLW